MNPHPLGGAVRHTPPPPAVVPASPAGLPGSGAHPASSHTPGSSTRNEAAFAAPRPELADAAAKDVRTESSATDAEGRLAYHVPFGESGLMHMRAGRLRDSLVHLFTFEKIHAAAHRALARKYNLEVQQQAVRLATGVAEGGALVAVAGVTETRFVPASRGISDAPPPEPSAPSPPTPGDVDAPQLLPDTSAEETAPAPPASSETLLLRELAYLQSGSGMIRIGGAAIYGESKRVLPLLKTTGSMGAYRRALGNASTLRTRTDAPDVLDLLRTLRPQALDEMIRAMEPLEAELQALTKRLDAIESSGTALSGVRLSGGLPQVKGEILSPETPIRSYEVEVRQLATAQEVRSDFGGWFLQPFGNMKTPDGAPVLSGAEVTFTLNGSVIRVGESDNPYTLARRINQGDSDTANGTDPGDAVDGTARHGVRASVEGGQLHLRMTPASLQRMQVRDPDDFLRNLRVVEDGDDGRMRFVVETRPPRGGVVTVDGARTHTETNVTERAIQGVRLTLLEEGSGSIAMKVGADWRTLRAELDDLAHAYNGIMERFGKALGRVEGGVLARQFQPSLAYLDLAGSAQDAFSAPFGAVRTPSDLGIDSNPADRSTFHAVQLDHATARLREGAAHPLQRAQTPNSVYNALGTVGLSRSIPDTLQVDEKQLREAVVNDLDAVRSALRDTDMGWVVRMAKAARTSAKEETGRLALGSLRLQALQGTRVPGWVSERMASMRNLDLLTTLKPLDILG